MTERRGWSGIGGSGSGRGVAEQVPEHQQLAQVGRDGPQVVDLRASDAPRTERGGAVHVRRPPPGGAEQELHQDPDRKSTRLNSSHSQISYAVFCLKKKKT